MLSNIISRSRNLKYYSRQIINLSEGIVIVCSFLNRFRRLEGETLNPYAHPQLPQIKKHVSCNSKRKMFSTLQSQQKEKRYSPCLAIAQPMRWFHNSANENPLHFELPVSSNEPFVTALHKSLLSSIK